MQTYQRAVSLIELIIALALLGTLLSFAAPSFGKLLQYNRDEALRNLLRNQLQQARTRAILHNSQNWLCGSSDGLTCNGDWSSHWLLIAPRDTLILQQQQLPQRNGLCWRGFNKSIRFHANGTTPIGNGRFSLCRDGKVVWALTLNRQGRVRDSSAEPHQNCCPTNHTGT